MTGPGGPVIPVPTAEIPVETEPVEIGPGARGPGAQRERRAVACAPRRSIAVTSSADMLVSSAFKPAAITN